MSNFQFFFRQSQQDPLPQRNALIANNRHAAQMLQFQALQRQVRRRKPETRWRGATRGSQELFRSVATTNDRKVHFGSWVDR